MILDKYKIVGSMIQTAQEFIRLRSSEDPSEYGRAANDVVSDDAINEILAKHPEYIEWIVHNKKAPEWLLRCLAMNADPRIRFSIATKRKCPVDIMLTLATDNDDSVRMALARNPKAPDKILLMLKNDNWEEIRLIANKRLSDCP